MADPNCGGRHRQASCGVAHGKAHVAILTKGRLQSQRPSTDQAFERKMRHHVISSADAWCSLLIGGSCPRFSDWPCRWVVMVASMLGGIFKILLNTRYGKVDVGAGTAVLVVCLCVWWTEHVCIQIFVSG